MADQVRGRLKDKIEETILHERRLFISEVIDSKSASKLIRKLWYLEMVSPGKEILLIINSPGGSVDAGFAIWDQIQMISSPVTTLVTGLAASMGSILSLAASPKRRFATPHSRIMIHQPLLSGVVRGQATDLEIQARELLKTRDMITNIYSEKTGKSKEEVERAIDRDTWMSSEEALAWGLLDGVIRHFSELIGS